MIFFPGGWVYSEEKINHSDLRRQIRFTVVRAEQARRTNKTFVIVECFS